MKQEFNWAMDQVKLPPEAEERILRALEDRAQAPRRKRRKGPLIAVLAAAAALLMGAAAVWQSNLFQYFQGPGGSPVSALSQFASPVGISGTSEDGWTLTVDECMGDDQWVFLWITLSAPEGTQLPILQEGDAFYVNVYALDLGMDKIQVYDMVPGDNQLNVAAGLRAGRSLRGETVSLQVSQIQYRPGASGEIIHLQNGEFVVDGITLDYPNTVTYSQPMVRVPYFDTGAEITELKVTPFSISMEFVCSEPVMEIIDRQFRQNLGESPYPTDPYQRRGELEAIFQGLDEPVFSFSVSMKNGTVWDLTATVFDEPDENPYQFTGHWDYRLETLRPGTWDESFFLDPSQIDFFTLNGVEIPFAFDPQE